MNLKQIKDTVEALDRDGSMNCPNCPNIGWYPVYDLSGNGEQQQCPFCYAEPRSLFNFIAFAHTALPALLRITEEYAAKLKDLASCLQVDGGSMLILAERSRQQSEEGWTAEHDDTHTRGELGAAARAYVKASEGSKDAVDEWPWDHAYFKPVGTIRNLIKAGALFMAEKDRLIRCDCLSSAEMMMFRANDCADRLTAALAEIRGE